MSNSQAGRESIGNLFHERTILDGLLFGSVAYGVHFTVFIWCMHLLVQKQKTRLDWFFVVYVTLLFIFGNVGNATNIKLGEILWADKRDYPGGPAAFFANGGGPYNLTCNVTYIINSWFQDGMLIWRFWMFFVREGRWYLAILPGLMFLSVVGLSLVLIIRLCSPGISLWSTISVNLAIPYWTISIALNIIITACITARLLYLRYQMCKLIDGSGAEYLSGTAMFVESAALYTTNALIFLVSYALNSPIQNLALPVLGQTQSIAPLLIILRVLQGRAWSFGSPARFQSTVTGGFIHHGDCTSIDCGPAPLVRIESKDSTDIPASTGARNE